MCPLPPDKSNGDALLDDGGINQTALHLPQVRGDDVDVKLGKLEGRKEGDTAIILGHRVEILAIWNFVLAPQSYHSSGITTYKLW